eukprot:scaffold33193_cov70-Cyclotella_meneghiniana.AAC.3
MYLYINIQQQDRDDNNNNKEAKPADRISNKEVIGQYQYNNKIKNLDKEQYTADIVRKGVNAIAIVLGGPFESDRRGSLEDRLDFLPFVPENMGVK